MNVNDVRGNLNEFFGINFKTWSVTIITINNQNKSIFLVLCLTIVSDFLFYSI